MSCEQTTKYEENKREFLEEDKMPEEYRELSKKQLKKDKEFEFKCDNGDFINNNNQKYD